MSDAIITFPILGDVQFNPARFIQIGKLQIAWYGVIIATGFLLAVLYACRRSKDFGLTSDNIFDLIIWCVPLAIICGRIYYVIFDWQLYRDNPSEIYKLWHGGIAFYGVLIGGLVGVILYSKKMKIPFGTLMDIGCLGLLIGQFIGRWGNFVNREAYGYETDVAWKMGLTVGGNTTYVHPTFLYESLWTLAGFIFLHFYSKKHRRYDGQVFGLYLFWYGLARLLIEGLRTDSLYLGATGIRVSQVVGFLTSVGAIVYLLWNRYRIAHDPADLYVNRAAAAAEAAGEDDSAASDEEDAAEEGESGGDVHGEDYREPYDIHKDKELFGDDEEETPEEDGGKNNQS